MSAQPVEIDATKLKSAGKTYEYLDSLRFLAALLVVLNHLRVNQFASYSEVQASSAAMKTVFFCITRVGLEAVMLFFVLSGFLVGGISVERFMSGKFDGVKYFIDRFTRIYTPFVPALSITIGLCIWYGIPFAWPEALLNLASLQGILCEPFSGNTSLWSLSYEVWFYLLCGALLTLFKAEDARTKALMFLLVCVCALAFSRMQIPYLFAWLIGLAAYFLRRLQVWFIWPTCIIITLSGLVLMQLTSRSEQIDLASYKYLDRSFAILCLALGLGLLVAALAHLQVQSPTLARINRIGGSLSQFSYSLYLLHIPAIVVLRHTGVLVRHEQLNLHSLAAYAGNTCLIVGASFGFYLLFERHTAKVRQLLYCRLAQS